MKLELLEAAPASSSSTGTAATQSVTGEVVSAATSSLSLMAEGDMVYDFDFFRHRLAHRQCARRRNRGRAGDGVLHRHSGRKGLCGYTD